MKLTVLPFCRSPWNDKAWHLCMQIICLPPGMTETVNAGRSLKHWATSYENLDFPAVLGQCRLWLPLQCIIVAIIYYNETPPHCPQSNTKFQVILKILHGDSVKCLLRHFKHFKGILTRLLCHYLGSVINLKVNLKVHFRTDSRHELTCLTQLQRIAQTNDSWILSRWVTLTDHKHSHSAVVEVFATSHGHAALSVLDLKE